MKSECVDPLTGSEPLKMAKRLQRVSAPCWILSGTLRPDLTTKPQISMVKIKTTVQESLQFTTTSITNLPRIHFCAGTYTKGNTIEPYLTVYCAESFNGFNTLVVLNCVGGANSGSLIHEVVE